MKKTIKILSVFLTVVMFCSVFSVANPVLAADIQETEELVTALKEAQNETQTEFEATAITEVVSKRDRFTKVFANDDGTQTAVISSTPIHYESGGEWVDIDNTLVKEGGSFINESNDFTASIPDELSSDSSIKIEKNGYSISFKLQGTDIFESGIKSKGKKKARGTESGSDEKGLDTEFLNKNAGLQFNDIGENTDVEYTVTSTGIKENIILNQKPEGEVMYKYTITAKGLNAQLNSDNSVSFKNEDGEEIFNVPAPVMYDEKGETSADIKVDFSGANGKYIMVYKPSSEWLKTATYPVVIDPVIDTDVSQTGVVETYVTSAATAENYGNNGNIVVSETEDSESISYINVANDYIFQSGVKIKSVTLGVYYGMGIFLNGSAKVGAYPITDSWSENTVTYATKPETGSLLDYVTIKSSDSSYYRCFDVTKAYISDEMPCGIALKQTDDSPTGTWMAFYSSENSTYSDYQPYFIIEYYESQGVEDQYDYHVLDAGRAGTVYFNDFTNQIYIERDELGLSGINMPVQIKRYYNSGIGGTYSYDYAVLYDIYAAYGVGWRTNYNQSIEYCGVIDGKEHILYCNGEGQTTYFAKTDETSSDGKVKWAEATDKFSNGSGYTLWLSSEYDPSVSKNLQYATVEDSSGQVYEFNSDGLLTKINSADEESTDCITVTYSNGGYTIDTVTDGAGRYYKFNYTEGIWEFPLLTSIKAYTKSGKAITTKTNVNYEITYTYSLTDLGGFTVPVLTSATYPDGETVNYTVSDSLTTVQNIDGYTLEFKKVTNNWYEISELVYTDSQDEPTEGGRLRVIVSESNYECAVRDANGVTQVKQYDLYGRVINVINRGGTNAPRTYSENIMSNGQVTNGLYVDYEYATEYDGENLVTNGSFESNLSGWDISKSSNVSRASTVDCIEENETPGSLYLEGEKTGLHYAEQIIEVEDGVAGDEYCLDFYVKSTNSHNNIEMLYLSMIMIQARKNVNGNETWEDIGCVDVNPFNSNWQNYSYEFEVGVDYNEIGLTIVSFVQYGKAWYDNISLVNTFKAVELASSSGSDGSSEEDQKGCTCSYCESNCTCEHSGSTVCTPVTCPACGECTCDKCTQYNCPCRDCSENCTLTYCNRSYDFGSDSTGSWFEISDGEKVIGMSQTVSGNYYDSQTDVNGVYTGYNYDQSNGQLKSTSDGNEYVTSYTYDAMSRLKSVSKSVSDLSSGNKMTTEYAYENDRIKSITHNGYSYNYEYDVWGNITSVKVGEQSLVSYSYGEGRDRSQVNRITYGNGDYTDYTYSDDGYVTALRSYSAEAILTADYEYTYGEYGETTKIKNNIENTEVRYEDSKTSIVLLNGEGGTDDVVLYSTEIKENGDTVEILGGKEYNNIRGTTTSDASSGATTSRSSIEYDETTLSFESKTDYFGRLISSGRSVEPDLEADEGVSVKSAQYGVEYGYKNVADEPSRTTFLVNSYKIGYRYNIEITDESLLEELPEGFEFDDFFIGTEYLYDYNSNGSIAKVSQRELLGYEKTEATVLCSYVYDEAEQLVRENNFDLGKTYVYVYDKGGNISQKIEYEATEGELGESLSTVNYTYDSAWKDKLTAYGDTAITTDSLGNPLNYVGNNVFNTGISGTLEWNGRQLEAVQLEGRGYKYTYDSNGLRTSVTQYSHSGKFEAMYRYFWEGNQLAGYLVSDENGDIIYTIKMMYNDSGESIGYIFVNMEEDIQKILYFEKNLQGDILSVKDKEGNKFVSYTYDAWGNISSEFYGNDLSEGMESLLILLLTPITYRGYMYDPITGLYYLQSRYYNPTYGRFLNADTTDILTRTAGTIHGANLFAYCENNPVMNVDSFGTDAASVTTISFILLLAYAVISILAIVISLSTISINGVTDSKYYNPGAFLQALRELYQTIEKNKTLLIGALYSAALLALNKGFNNNSANHHIIAQSSIKASVARFYFLAVGGDVTENANIVTVHEVFHWFLHSDIYYLAIDGLITESYYFHGEYSRKVSVYNTLSAIKTTIKYINAAAPWSW